MQHSSNSVDYLCLSPLRALVSICLPLILVNLVLLCTTAATNHLYSRYAGQTYFTVTGYTGVVTSLFVSILSSVYLAGWIKTAHKFALYDKNTATYALLDALLAMLLVCCGATVLFVLFTKPILRALSIPVQFYSSTRTYYILYIVSYLPSALAALFLTVTNGISSAKRIFWINILVIITNLLGAALLLAVFRLEMIGAVLCGALSACVQLLCYIFLFRRSGFFHTGNPYRPDWAQIGAILRYSVLLALQSLLCTAGYLLVALQANRLLAPEYITVLNVSLPLSSVMSAVGSAILAFCPQNYGAGRSDRLQSFLRLTIVCSFLYGLLCFGIYAGLGKWYYARLFEDAQIVRMGGQFWFWQGVGFIFLALLTPIRYFFDSVGMSRLSLLSGIGELIGNCVSAFALIPNFGNIGRSLAYPLGWAIACMLLISAFLLSRNQIYSRCKMQYAVKTES